MIKSARKRKGLTQKELAKRLNVNQSYISKAENRNIDTFSVEFILNLSRILSLCPSDVFTFLITNNCKSCEKLNCNYKKYINAKY